MKKLLTIFILIGVMIFPMQIHADSFQDQCSSSESTQLRETYNLIVSSYGLQGTITPPLDDLSALSVSDYHQPGELVYAVKNIDHVRVSLYRYFASFAVRYSDGTLAYNTLPNASEQFELLPLWIDRTNDKVYCQSDNQYYLLQFDKLKGCNKFSDEPQEPEQALFPYGLSIQESFDGATFEPVEMEMVDVAKFTRDDGKVIFEEVFEADLSTSCRYLKIQIEQYPTIETIYMGGMTGISDINVSDATMVADVTCTGPQHDQYPDGGAGLPEGITEETDEEETKQEKSSSSSSSSSTKSSAAGSEETTTIERSSSSETTTTDSNNTSTSTSYTTNQYYFILSDENSEVMQEVFEQMGIENITKEDSDTAEDTSDGDEQDTVVSVSSDVTAAAVSGQTQTLYSDAQNGNNSSNDILLYYIIFGISLLIVLRVISLVRMPRRRPSDQEDDL